MTNKTTPLRPDRFTVPEGMEDAASLDLDLYNVKKRILDPRTSRDTRQGTSEALVPSAEQIAAYEALKQSHDALHRAALLRGSNYHLYNAAFRDAENAVQDAAKVFFAFDPANKDPDATAGVVRTTTSLNASVHAKQIQGHAEDYVAGHTYKLAQDRSWNRMHELPNLSFMKETAQAIAGRSA